MNLPRRRAASTAWLQWGCAGDGRRWLTAFLLSHRLRREPLHSTWFVSSRLTQTHTHTHKQISLQDYTWIEGHTHTLHKQWRLRIRPVSVCDLHLFLHNEQFFETVLTPSRHPNEADVTVTQEVMSAIWRREEETHFNWLLLLSWEISPHVFHFLLGFLLPPLEQKNKHLILR